MAAVRSKFEAALKAKQSERRRLKRQKLSVDSSMVSLLTDLQALKAEAQVVDTLPCHICLQLQDLSAHAALLGLCACVRAHPYDVPTWLPSTLMVRRPLPLPNYMPSLCPSRPFNHAIEATNVYTADMSIRRPMPTVSPLMHCLCFVQVLADCECWGGIYQDAVRKLVLGPSLYV